MSGTGLVLGLLADQHGVTGLRLPFLAASARRPPPRRFLRSVMIALCIPPSVTRVGLARWRIETGDEIPNACPRPAPLRGRYHAGGESRI